MTLLVGWHSLEGLREHARIKSAFPVAILLMQRNQAVSCRVDAGSEPDRLNDPSPRSKKSTDKWPRRAQSGPKDGQRQETHVAQRQS